MKERCRRAALCQSNATAPRRFRQASARRRPVAAPLQARPRRLIRAMKGRWREKRQPRSRHQGRQNGPLDYLRAQPHHVTLPPARRASRARRRARHQGGRDPQRSRRASRSATARRRPRCAGRPRRAACASSRSTRCSASTTGPRRAPRRRRHWRATPRAAAPRRWCSVRSTTRAGACRRASARRSCARRCALLRRS